MAKQQAASSKRASTRTIRVTANAAPVLGALRVLNRLLDSELDLDRRPQLRRRALNLLARPRKTFRVDGDRPARRAGHALVTFHPSKRLLNLLTAFRAAKRDRRVRKTVHEGLPSRSLKGRTSKSTRGERPS